jgi:hypothetical protein
MDQIDKSEVSSKTGTVRHWILCEVCARKVMTYGLEEYEFMLTGKGRSVGYIQPYTLKNRKEKTVKVSKSILPRNKYLEGFLVSLIMIPINVITYLLTGIFYYVTLFLMPLIWIGYVVISIKAKRNIESISVNNELTVKSIPDNSYE